MVASGRTSAYGTSDAARVLSGITPQASRSSASTAVNGLLTLASANGVAGVTFRPLLLSATPLTAVAVLPSSQRSATDSPGYRVRRFSRHVETRCWMRSCRAGSSTRGEGSGTGRAAQAFQPPLAARAEVGVPSCANSPPAARRRASIIWAIRIIP